MKLLDVYKDIGATSEVMGATPWQEINLLLNKLDNDISSSITAINSNDVVNKCKRLVNAHDIILYLQDCLNITAGGELAARLAAIYTHLKDLVFWANAKNDLNKLTEAKKITENLCSWWKNVNA